MAQKGLQLDEEAFSCSICLVVLKDSVTIPCGHIYCLNCIKSFWKEENVKKLYSCPQCRQTFTPRPVLVKNTMLAVLVEELKKTGLQAAPADHCYAGPEDVSRNVCTGRKLEALKSCLMCLVSCCEEHQEPPYDVAPLKNQKLVEPSKNLQENICSGHDEVMKMFCRTDQQCICYLCSVEEHKGHDTVSAAAERTERQRELEGSRQQILQIIQYREKDVKVLQQEVEALNRSAEKTVEDSEKIFTELIRLIEKRRSEVKQQIRSQQETEVSRVKELLEKLEQEITELKRKDAELEQLSHTEDHNQFLQKYCSPTPTLVKYSYFSTSKPHFLQYFDTLQEAISQVTKKLQDIQDMGWTNMSLAVTDMGVLLLREPKTRDEFLTYSRQIILDPNTVNERLSLSEDDREVTYMKYEQSYPDHPDRCTDTYQVLSREGLTGRCYWEVEKGKAGVLVAVTYKDSDTVDEKFGDNDTSWALGIYSLRYEFRHNNVTTPVSGPRSSTIGVYLDHSAGILSFYSVSETMTLLHRVQTTFTEPLYAGIYLYGPNGNSAELCELETTECTSCGVVF